MSWEEYGFLQAVFGGELAEAALFAPLSDHNKPDLRKASADSTSHGQEEVEALDWLQPSRCPDQVDLFRNAQTRLGFPAVQPGSNGFGVNSIVNGHGFPGIRPLLHLGSYIRADADDAIRRPARHEPIGPLQKPLLASPEPLGVFGQAMLGPHNDGDAATPGKQRGQHVFLVAMRMQNANVPAAKIQGRLLEDSVKPLFCFGDDLDFDPVLTNLIRQAPLVEQDRRQAQVFSLRQDPKQGSQLGFCSRPKITRNHVAHR